MNYLQEIFIQSVADVYEDIVKINLENDTCTYLYAQQGTLEELDVPVKWPEIRRVFLSNIHPDDRQAVITQWYQAINEHPTGVHSFAFTYRPKNLTKDTVQKLWTMNIVLMDVENTHCALLFSKDNTIDSWGWLHLKELTRQKQTTILHNRLKLNDMIETVYEKLDSCGVLYFDINDFSKFRHHYGENAGQELFNLVKNSICDLQNEQINAYRYGKDEFIVIVNNYSKNEFRKLIQKWVDNWKTLCLDKPEGYSLALGSSWDCSPILIRELIAKAEANMFRNKKLMKSGVPMDYYVQGEIFSSYGLNQRKEFFETVEFFLDQRNEPYCLAAIDIEHFKLFNKWSGKQAGDELLISISRVLKHYEDVYDSVAAYMGGDKFAIFLPDNDELIKKMAQKLIQVTKEKTNNAGFLPAIGIYKTGEEKIDATVMYDFATEAQLHALGNYDNRISYYDETMTSTAEEELSILIESKEAIEQKQYTFYLQPKCNIITGKIVGAEALVRWIHPEKGLISPGVFIPVLEKNGFISGLDAYLWEAVCAKIREWMDNGITPVPISINVSRIDILTLDVVERLNSLIEKYQIDKKYLKIEITESAYAENTDKVLETITKLRDCSFTLLMDDFGSGYSSLNMLRNMDIDILKLDMKFLDFSHDNIKKGLGILKSVINMSNEMDLPVVVEGVETEDQVSLLIDMKVRYAQGYFFYKPMPIEQFEDIIRDENNVDYRGIYSKKIDIFQMNEVLESFILAKEKESKKMELSKMPGGFITYKADETEELLAVGTSVAFMFGCETIEEFREYVGNNFSGMVHPDDREYVQNEIIQQVQDTEWQMDYIKYRIIRKDGTIRYINDFGHLENDADGKNPHFHVFLLDVTDQVEKEI